MKKNISVVILNHNRTEPVRMLLNALKNQTIPASEMEIILIDNNERKSAAKKFREFNELGIKFLEINECCPAAARNQGIMAASAPIILLLDDDVIPASDCIEKHLAAHKNLTEKDLVLGHVDIHPDICKTHVINWLYTDGAQFDYSRLHDGHNTMGLLYASNLSFKKSVSDAVVFNERFPKAAWEDIELGYRIAEKGFRIMYYSDINAYHYKHESVSTVITRMKRMGRYYPLYVEISQRDDDKKNLARIVNPDQKRKILNNLKGILFWDGIVFKTLLQEEITTCPRITASFFYYYFERACRWAINNKDIAY